MSPARKFALFALGFAGCLALLEAYARRAVRTTPARQALSRYQPAGPHAVFLGSSLTDAAVRAGLLDSLLGGRKPGFRAYNLALAGLGGGDAYYLIAKNHVLARGRPDLLVVEASGLPFFPPEAPFRLEGTGSRIDSFRPELMEYADLAHLSGGFPGPATTLSYWLHRHSAAYHLRWELQARLRERLPRPSPEARPAYRMADGAVERFAANARRDGERLAAMPDGHQAMRRPEAYFVDLAALARGKGVRLVVVRPPCKPMEEALAGERAKRYAAEFARLCDSLGVAFIDGWEDAGRVAGLYSDGIHLDGEGSRLFTASLGERLAPLLD